VARVPDGCLVPTGPLAEILEAFLNRWKRDRPPTAGQFSSSSTVSPILGIQWLSAESGVSESTIQNIVDRRYRGTELRIAEALVVGALERPDLFDEALEVYPNPSAPAWARAECCGGSGAAPRPPVEVLAEILRVNLAAASAGAVYA
jgi:hypothetical protein